MTKENKIENIQNLIDTAVELFGSRREARKALGQAVKTIQADVDWSQARAYCENLKTVPVVVLAQQLDTTNQAARKYLKEQPDFREIAPDVFQLAA